jgi:hypothetical protein
MVNPVLSQLVEVNARIDEKVDGTLVPHLRTTIKHKQI